MEQLVTQKMHEIVGYAIAGILIAFLFVSKIS